MPHYQLDLIENRHIWYTAIAGIITAATSNEASACECAPGCTATVEEVWEFTMSEDTVFKAWTFGYWFGDESAASYLDWINPLELVAAGAQVGRDIDRYSTMQLDSLIITIECDDGTSSSLVVGPDGTLLNANFDDGTGNIVTKVGSEVFE